MPPITIINTFVLPCLVTILLFGALLNIKYRQKNIYRNYLVSILLIWALMMIFGYVKYFLDGRPMIEYNSEVLSVPIIFLGILCFISIISYPIVILDATRLKLSNGVRLTMPILISMSVYVIWHLLTGNDPFIQFSTYGELMANISTTTVILRISLIASFIIYIILILIYIWRVVPVYNQYISENIANSDCNVGWIRGLVKYVIIFMLCYFVVLGANSPYVNLICMLSAIPLFIYIVEQSLFYKTSERIEALKLSWSSDSREWLVSKHEGQLQNIDRSTAYAYERQIDQWMTKFQPFIKADFSTKDILTQFPEISNDELTSIFKLKNETFQSYVRTYRINLACSIIEKEEGEVSLKQLFLAIGFSHYSSFSRSFLSVKNITPSDYLKRVKSRLVTNQYKSNVSTNFTR